MQKPSFPVASAVVDISGYSLRKINQEFMIEDLELARRLGYDNPHNIRKLIRRMLDRGQICRSGVFSTVEKTSELGGRPGTSYHLGQKAAIKVVTRSETPIADKIVDEVIDVFVAARDGKSLRQSNLDEYARIFLEMAILNPPTPGYFSVLRGAQDVLLACIQAGLPFNQHNLAVISMGHFWKRYYDAKDLASFYGKPRKFRQRYPDAFPQSAADDFKGVWHYPLASVEAFERWLMIEYLPKHYPGYIGKKVKVGTISVDTQVRLLEAMNQRFLLGAA